MDKNQIEKIVLNSFAVAYNKDVTTLSCETRIAEDLSPKSMLLVGLVGTLESELDVMVSLPEASKMKTIGDMVDKVCSLMSEE